MSSRDDIPKPDGSLTDEQRQAMARLEKRRAERMAASQSQADTSKTFELEASLQSNEPQPVLSGSGGAPGDKTPLNDSIEWSIEEPPALDAPDAPSVEVGAAKSSASAVVDAAASAPGEVDFELSTPGLATTDTLASRPPVPGALSTAGRQVESPSIESPLPKDTSGALPQNVRSAAEDSAPIEDDVADVDDMLPKVEEVARDVRDYQALRASKSPMKRVMDDLSSRMFRNTAGVATTAVVVCTSAALLIWSVFFRLDILDEVVALEMVELDLEDKHATLALQLSALNTDSMESEIQQQSTRIFPGFPALANWIERVSERAEGMNMNVRYRVEPASYAPVDEVLEVPVVIELEVASEDDSELFSRGMGLIASLLQDHWHLDIASTTAKGDGEGMRTLEMEARVWVFDVEEFVSSSLIADRSSAGEAGSTGMEFGGDAEIIQ